MYSLMDTWGFLRQVSPFGHLRVNGYVRLTAAFRSLSRPSSAPSAKAFALCSLLLDLCVFQHVFLSFYTQNVVAILQLIYFYDVNAVLNERLLKRRKNSNVLEMNGFHMKYEKTTFFFDFMTLTILYSVFKVHTVCFRNCEMEIARLELATPCLQGRCSPNWAKPPKVICLFYFYIMISPIFCKKNGLKWTRTTDLALIRRAL